MKAIVIYQSKRGATKRYAEWIADELGCSSIPLAACDMHSLEQFDVIVFGGWIRGSGIVGFDKLKNAIPELMGRVVIFADGIAENTPDNFLQIMDINLGEDLKEVPLFVLGGAYDPAKVTGLDSLMMKFAKHVVVSGKTSADAENAEKMRMRIENGVDLVDESSIESVIKAARSKAAVKAGDLSE